MIALDVGLTKYLIHLERGLSFIMAQYRNLQPNIFFFKLEKYYF